ncbi:MAG: hypothetical protein ABIA63_10465 [bacterium]
MINLLKTLPLFLIIILNYAWSQTKTDSLPSKKRSHVDSIIQDELHSDSLKRIAEMVKIAYTNKGKSWLFYPEKYSYCSFGKCVTETLDPKKNLHFSFFDRANETVSRCVDDDCSYYNARYEETGIMLRVQCVESNGFIIAVNLAKLTYVEAITTSQGVMVYYGNCKNLAQFRQEKK